MSKRSKPEKVTNPMFIAGFNRHMCWLTLYVLFLSFYAKHCTDIPAWLMFIIQGICCLGIVGGLIICLGYLVAICEKNVTILEIKKDKEK